MAIRSGDKGILEITKVDDNWQKENSFFNAVCYDTDKTKTIEVTDGFFRITIAKKQ